MSTKETNSEKSEKIDKQFLKFMCIWIPIMIVLFTYTLTNDPDSLLTDEQKLEKQKEIQQAKEQRDKDWKENVSDPFTEGYNWLLYDKPFPFNILIGLGIFWIIATGHNAGYYRHMDSALERFSNPFTFVPVTFGVIYLLWLSGDLENWGII